MAFFDKLSKTVTEVSQKTIAKAKELADTSRLNSMISEEEKVIANQYFQIGKLYFYAQNRKYINILFMTGSDTFIPSATYRTMSGLRRTVWLY